MKAAVRIASVCRVLPTPDDAASGAFVHRRLAAMARLADIRVIQPVPYMPLIRPLPGWAREEAHVVSGLRIEHAPMLYVPGALKSLDGRWLERSVYARLSEFRARHPDGLVDAHFGYPDGTGCVRAARRLGLPAFVTVRGMEVDALKEPSLRRQLVSALHSATGCISVSHSLREVMLGEGLDPEKIRTIPNAVDRQLFRPGDRQAARAGLDIPCDGKLVVTVGHLVRGKRQDVLIRALARLRSQLPGARLAIIGGAAYDAAYPGHLRTIIAEAGLAQVVHFVGRIAPDEVARWLQAADCFAHASEREGCCNAVLEALAAGLPVIATPVGDNREFVSNDVNGRLVPVGDVESTAEAMAAVLQRSWDPHAISASLAVGDWDSVARSVLQFFAERLSGYTRTTGPVTLPA